MILKLELKTNTAMCGQVTICLEKGHLYNLLKMESDFCNTLELATVIKTNVSLAAASHIN